MVGNPRIYRYKDTHTDALLAYTDTKTHIYRCTDTHLQIHTEIYTERERERE